MGFVRERTLKISFADDHPFAGLEVRTRRMSVGEYEQLMELMGTDLDEKSIADPAKREEFFKLLRRPIEMFCDALVSWNLEEKDKDGNNIPVPATRDEVMADFPFAAIIIKEWVKGIRGISDELGKESPSGETSPAPPLPMEPLSPNP